jgi:hypothetical protein
MSLVILYRGQGPFLQLLKKIDIVDKTPIIKYFFFCKHGQPKTGFFVLTLLRADLASKPSEQCCGSGMFIPDPGSRILIFTHPGSRISDPGSKNR